MKYNFVPINWKYDDLNNMLEASQDASSQTVIENGAEFSLQRSTFKVWKHFKKEIKLLLLCIKIKSLGFLFQ